MSGHFHQFLATNVPGNVELTPLPGQRMPRIPSKDASGWCWGSLLTHGASNLYGDMANISSQCCPHLCHIKQEVGGASLHHIIFTAGLSNAIAKDGKIGKKAEEWWHRKWLSALLRIVIHLAFFFFFKSISKKKIPLIYLCIGIVCQFTAPLFVSSCTFPSGLYHFLHITSSSIFWWHVLLEQLLCLSFLIFLFLSITCISFPSTLRWSHLYGRPFTCTRLHYFGSLLFLISFITTDLFPSALYLLGDVLCPTHLNPLPSCVSVLCEVEKKKTKNSYPFSPSVVFLNFPAIQKATCLEPGLFLGWLQPVSYVSVTLTSLITIIELKRHNLGKDC